MKLLQSTEGIVNIRSIFLYEDGSKMATQARSRLDEVILRRVALYRYSVLKLTFVAGSCG